MFRLTSTLNRNLYKRAITQPMLFTSPVENKNFTFKIAERSSSSNEKHEKEKIEKPLAVRKPPPKNKMLEIEKFIRQWDEDNKNDDKGERYARTRVIIKVPSNNGVYETRIDKILRDITTELEIKYSSSSLEVSPDDPSDNQGSEASYLTISGFFSLEIRGPRPFLRTLL